jgi:hypothetical protein
MAVGYAVELAARTLMAPLMLAVRWAIPRPFDDEEVPNLGASWAMAAKQVLDEIFFSTELVTGQFVSAGDRRRIRTEVYGALRHFETQGWLECPALYHRTPPALWNPELRSVETRGLRYVHLQFESGYEPHPGEPGRERWLGYAPNHTAHAWVLQHPGGPRPWMVCVHGYRMGAPLVDFVGFRALWLHHQMGLNVLMPILPLHGPRTVGRRSGDGFLTGDYLDTLHLQAHAIWDLRRLLGWLRATQGDPPIGVYGLSLGGYTAALLAALEADLQCVIVGIPATNFVRLARWHIPSFLHAATEFVGLHWDELETIMRVVSPLAMPARVPRERCFLFAGVADRLVPPDHVRDLWRHWDRPRIEWYEGGHVSFTFEGKVRALVCEALATTGLAGGQLPAPAAAAASA